VFLGGFVGKEQGKWGEEGRGRRREMGEKDREGKEINHTCDCHGDGPRFSVLPIHPVAQAIASRHVSFLHGASI
jgi:hypothetical protein